MDSDIVVVNTSSTGHGTIFYSCDGGRSFVPTLKNTAASEAAVWDTAAGVLYAADNTNRFYCSHDHGRTWHRSGRKFPYQQQPKISHLCSLASFVEDGRRAFYVTTSYPAQIFRTIDTGWHWRRIYADTAYRFREIPKLGKLRDGRFFAASAQGIIDAPGSILIGSRRGSQWKKMAAPEGLWYFDELPSRPGFIVAGGFSLGKNAGNAALFLTGNYGTSWTAKQVKEASLVWKVECVLPSSWLLATDKGLLFLNIHSLN